MENEIKVSVIVPTYNRAYMIEKCLDSIVNQSFHEMELIIVDDGSTDNTQQVVSGYINNSHFPISYIHQDNGGAPAARNNGLMHAKGDFIVFFDSDDYMDKDRIKLQYEEIQKTGSDCCICGFNVQSSNIDVLPPKHIGDYRKQYARGEILCSTQIWMFKKDQLLKIGGYTLGLVCMQDLDLTFRYLWFNDLKICVVRKSLTIFVDHDCPDRIMKKWYTEAGLGSRKTVVLNMIKTIAQIRSLYIYSYVSCIVIYLQPYIEYHRLKDRKSVFRELIEVINSYSFFYRVTIVALIYFKTYYRDLRFIIKTKINVQI